MVDSNNAINNTIGASISGVTNTLTVSNASDTASSAAREIITVGGASAGDASLNFNVNGVTDWEAGVDNSDADSLVIAQSAALGTKNVWHMDTNGARLLPLQPIFSVGNSVSIPNVTGDGTAYTVIFPDVNIDQASNYNNVTGIFTAPVTGTYSFSTTLFVGGLSASHSSLNLQFFTVGGTSVFYLNPTQARVGNDIIAAGSLIFRLNAAATVKVVLTVSGGTKTVTVGGSIFAGFLVG